MASSMLYRAMRSADDGLPELDASSRTLGARARIDIPLDRGGHAGPGTGGMSVSPDSPANLPRPRRPPEFGGFGRDQIYELHTSSLRPALLFRPDPDQPDEHGFVEPARRMTFEDYQRALWSTRRRWRKVLT